MKTAIRFDQMPLMAERDDQGFLVAPACYTRTGVFYYINDDGSVRAELRLAEEVFSDQAMKSMQMLPVTNDHPPVMLNPENSKQYTVGFSSENVTRKNDTANGFIKVTDKDAIADVENGRKEELSMGYQCLLEDSPGVWEGIKYDVIQRNIKYNHIALVEKGRAGSQCRIKTDSDDLRFKVNKPSNVGGKNMATKIIKVGKFDCEVVESSAQILKNHLDEQAEKEKSMMDEFEKMKKDLAEMKKKVDQMEGKKDAAEAELKKAQENLEEMKKDASDHVKMNKLVKERTDLIEKCKPFANEDTKFDELDNTQLKKLVVEKAYPEMKLDSASEDRIDGLFEGALLAQKNVLDRQNRTDGAMSNPVSNNDEDWEKEHRDSQSKRWQSKLGNK